MNECELMLTSVLDCRRVDLVANRVELSKEQQQRYDQMQSRRSRGEPLQYVIGETSFMGIPLVVDARVLIPRPETEILVELALQNFWSYNDSLRILDIGTGSGNIAIALARHVQNVEVTAIDISTNALTLAAENARANCVAEKIKFVHAGVAEYLNEAAGRGEKFDMIISNPPYIPTGQLAQLPDDVRQEPRLALDGGEDGLRYYRIILEAGPRVLVPASRLWMEIGDGQRAGIEAMFTKHRRYHNINFYRDYVGTDRVVSAELSGKR